MVELSVGRIVRGLIFHGRNVLAAFFSYHFAHSRSFNVLMMTNWLWFPPAGF